MREGWEIKKLADLCKTFADGDWIEKKDQSPSGIRLVQTGNVGNGVFRGKEDSRHYISQETFERLHCTEIFPGDILVSRLPEPVGRGCLIPETGERMITAVDCTIIRLNPGYLPQFLVYYSQSAEYQYSVREVSTGTTRQRISRKNLSEIGIPVPSLAEQQRIVDILDQEFAKIDALKANAEKSLQAAKDLFQATLKKELEPKEGWKVSSMGEVSSIARGGSPRPIKAFITEDADGINWIKIGDTEVGGKYISSTKEKIRKEGMRSSRFVEAGDFLLSNSMSFGRPYILKTNGCIHDGWLVIKKYEDTFTQDFLYYLLLSPSVVKQFEEGARGSTVRNLNTDIVSAVRVSYPSALQEQEEIVAQVEEQNYKCKALQDNYQKTLSLCDDLKQALLRKAFNGEL